MGKYIKSFDGTRIYYQYNKRKGLALVFLHGIGSNWTVWKNEINYFKRKGFPILAIDMRGHGKSDAPPEFGRYRFDNFAADIYQILKHEKINNFVLIGHSLGGSVSIKYCSLYKNKMPLSMVLVETSSIYPFDHDRILNCGPYLTHFLRFLANHKFSRKDHLLSLKDIDLSETGIKENINIISHLIHLTPLRTIVNVLDNIEADAFKTHKLITDTLRHLDFPVLIVAGELDKIIPPKYSIIMKRNVPSSEFRLLKGAHHRVIIDNPRQIEREIYTFLNEKVI